MCRSLPNISNLQPSTHDLIVGFAHAHSAKIQVAISTGFTVELLNKGHFGTSHFVFYREVKSELVI